MHYTQVEVYEYISKQINDPIIERKTCRISGVQFPIYASDLVFYDTISPIFGGKKYTIPTPTLCPEERSRRRMLFRNDRKLYKRTCDATGETIISMFDKHSPFVVYGYETRRSDQRDALSYGKTFDFSKTFTEQYKDLFLQVPRMGLCRVNNENCPYVSYAGHNKSCYMIYTADYNEDSCYIACSLKIKNSIDIECCAYCEHCYECMDCEHCYQCTYSQELLDCTACHYSSNLHNCSYCYDCHGLVNKTFCIQNKQYTQEEYMLQVKTYKKTHHTEEIKPQFSQIQCQETIGNYLKFSHNAYFCYDATKIEECRYCSHMSEAKNCYDWDFYGDKAERCYELGSMANNVYHCLFSGKCWGSSTHLLYCDQCMYCQDCFGCIGLRHKQYCIFNKQYTKETYEQEVANIIAHMTETGERGEFFSPTLSPFGYNETLAQQYFPLTPQEAKQRGYKRQENTHDPVIPEGVETLCGNQIEADITKVDDSILKKIFICEVSGRPFRIIQQELDFYRMHHIPLPRKHPDIRHQERGNKKPSRNLYLRNCDKTGEEIISVYPPDAPYKVYSTEAYQQELFG